MDCFDADVLIYAAATGHPLGRRVAALLHSDTQSQRVGSVLLLPEVLGKPLRDGAVAELDALARVLARLELSMLDHATAEIAAALSARYRLRAPDAVHLATAVSLGADRFITNNTRDFAPTITEVDIVTPADLPDPG